MTQPRRIVALRDQMVSPVGSLPRGALYYRNSRRWGGIVRAGGLYGWLTEYGWDRITHGSERDMVWWSESLMIL